MISYHLTYHVLNWKSIKALIPFTFSLANVLLLLDAAVSAAVQKRFRTFVAPPESLMDIIWPGYIVLTGLIHRNLVCRAQLYANR